MHGDIQNSTILRALVNCGCADLQIFEVVKYGEIRSGLNPGPLALNAARPGLKRGPAAHTILCNRNATSHAASKRRPPPGLVYCEVKLTTVGSSVRE